MLYKSGLVGLSPENQLLNIYQQPTGYLCPSETNGKLHCVGQGWGRGGKAVRGEGGRGGGTVARVRESGERKGRENSRKESRKRETGRGGERGREKEDRERKKYLLP